jgi:hypothetical protein
MKKTVILTNAEPSDLVFHNDQGSWNVTRALRDCRAGKHKIYLQNTTDAYEGSSAVEFDEAKVEQLSLLKVEDIEPLIAVIDGGVIWLIDGRHRLEVFHRRRVKDFPWYVIEEADAAPYRVLYNGQRKPPFKPY